MTKSALFNNSLKRGLEVLMAFGPKNPDMSLPELAAITGMNKSAIQRYTHTLHVLGFLSKNNKTKRYALTPKTVELGYRYLLVNPLIEKATPFLKELNRLIGETINLSVPNRQRMVYVARYATTLSASVYMPVGQTLPMFCTASGRAYLSLLSSTEVDKLLSVTEFVNYTPTTIIDPDTVRNLISEARESGYAYACGEYYRGDLNVAVPITDPNHKPVASINISAPSSRWSLEKMREELVPHLLSMGKQLSGGVTL